MCDAVVELLDDDDEVVDDWLFVLDDAGVAAQLEDDVPEAVAVAAGLAVLVPVFALAALVAVCAEVPTVWNAMTPLRPSSAATLAVAVALRARRAGCARFRRGIGSAISCSFLRGLGIIVGDRGKRSSRTGAKGG